MSAQRIVRRASARAASRVARNRCAAVLALGLASAAFAADAVAPLPRCEVAPSTAERLRCYREAYCGNFEGREADACLQRTIAALIAPAESNAAELTVPGPAQNLAQAQGSQEQDKEEGRHLVGDPVTADAAPADESRFGSRRAESADLMIAARVVALAEQRYGEYLIRLDNGMVWEEIARRNRTYRIGEEVTVVRGLFNSFRLRGDEGGNSRVRRLFCADQRLDAETAQKCALVRATGP